MLDSYYGIGINININNGSDTGRGRQAMGLRQIARELGVTKGRIGSVARRGLRKVRYLAELRSQGDFLDGSSKKIWTGMQ